MDAKRIPVVAMLVFSLLTWGCGGDAAQEDAGADAAMEAGEMDGAMESDAAADMGAEATDPLEVLEGTHEMSQGAVTVADGRYTYVSPAGDTLVYGRMMARGDTVVFEDEGGEMACMGQQGVYTMHMMNGEPELHVVDDPCEGRRADIMGEPVDMDMEGGEAPEAP